MKLVFSIEVKQTRILNENEKDDPNNMFFSIDSDSTYLDPPKFVELLKFINKNPGNHLIYSNYYNKGLLLFANFLTKKNIKFNILDPLLSNTKKNKILEDFKNKTINIILLHPSFYEGISIPGTKYFHLLEAISSFSKRSQLIGRSMRADSHIHLPKNSQSYQNSFKYINFD